MEFFNKIGDIASKTYKKTSKKTGEIAKEAKIKMKMNENKSNINNLYQEIGKIIYKKYLNKEEANIQEDLDSYCKKIEELSQEIEKYQQEVLSMKNKRICENCYTEIELTAKYCPNCGFEQPEEIKEESNEQPKVDEDNKKSEIEIKEED